MQTTIPNTKTTQSLIHENDNKSATNSLTSQIRKEAVYETRKSWSYYSNDCRNIGYGIPSSKKNGTQHNTPSLIIGIDTEYVQRGEGIVNHLLSYQFHAFEIDGEREWKGVHYVKGQKRMKLNELIDDVIRIGLKEKFLKEYPEEVFLCGHFNLADMPAFKDLPMLVKHLDSVRKTFVTLPRPLKVTCWDKNKHKHKLKVHVRDSMLLAPAGMLSLRALGEILKIQKVELEAGMIERMDELLGKDPLLYEVYALKDAEISAKYCDEMRKLNLKLLGEDTIPLTLSSIGLSLLFKVWENGGWDVDAILGKESIMDSAFNGQFKVRKEKSVALKVVHNSENIATECYHGGRNEQYLYGASAVGSWTDFDLSGAYTTAMALLGLPDWEEKYSSTDLKDFLNPMSLGYADIEFEFPPDTRFPCLPVRSEAGLLFPLKGSTYCCSPEIYLAHEMGATITIKEGIVIPQDLNQRPFAEFIQVATKKRKEQVKGSLFELAWKEMGNGTYGKTAQGLRPKRAYSCRTDEFDNLPPSRITNPYYAGWVTSFVRAVLGEILHALPSGVSVSNATTDGILCTASESQMRECTEAELCTLFKKARAGIVGKEECVEIKHRIGQVLGVKTRCQFTLMQSSGDDIVLAKGGVKPPEGTKAEQNDWMIEAFLNRDFKTKSPVKLLRSLTSISRNGGDLTPKHIHRAVRLDYDWKRQPVNLRMESIRGVPHLAFDTKPWASILEAIACRNDWEDFTKSSNRVLKSLDDYKAFEDFRLQKTLPKTLRRSRKGGTIKVAARQFLRAFVRNRAGLKKLSMSYGDVADILTELGVPTVKEDLENAVRSNAKLESKSIPRSLEILELFDALKEFFPEFDPDFLLISEESASTTAHGVCSNSSRSADKSSSDSVNNPSGGFLS